MWLISFLGDEMEEKQQLDEQMRAVMDKYKYKRRQIRELQEDLQTMSNTLDNLQRDEDAYVEMVEEKRVMYKWASSWDYGTYHIGDQSLHVRTHKVWK